MQRLKEYEGMKKASVIAMVLGAILFAPLTAHANTLVATSPISGATLQSAPSAVTITTELPLMDAGNEVSVTDPTGARVDDGALTIDGANAVVGLKQLVKTGIYSVNYSLLSENDVPLVGTFTFNFAEPTVVATVAPQPTQSATPSGNNLGTTIFVLGLLVAAIIVTIALSLYARKLYRER
jgi:methionine-rich copper-binding protein CopC